MGKREPIAWLTAFTIVIVAWLGLRVAVWVFDPPVPGDDAAVLFGPLWFYEASLPILAATCLLGLAAVFRAIMLAVLGSKRHRDRPTRGCESTGSG